MFLVAVAKKQKHLLQQAFPLKWCQALLLPWVFPLTQEFLLHIADCRLRSLLSPATAKKVVRQE